MGTSPTALSTGSPRLGREAGVGGRRPPQAEVNQSPADLEGFWFCFLLALPPFLLRDSDRNLRQEAPVRPISTSEISPPPRPFLLVQNDIYTQRSLCPGNLHAHASFSSLILSCSWPVRCPHILPASRARGCGGGGVLACVTGAG